MKNYFDKLLTRMYCDKIFTSCSVLLFEKIFNLKLNFFNIVSPETFLVVQR